MSSSAAVAVPSPAVVRRRPRRSRRSSLGRGLVGRTRARTRASVRRRPNSPNRGSSTISNSASCSSTPSWSRAASLASSTVRPVVSTHSMVFYLPLGRRRPVTLRALPPPVRPTTGAPLPAASTASVPSTVSTPSSPTTTISTTPSPTTPSPTTPLPALNPSRWPRPRSWLPPRRRRRWSVATHWRDHSKRPPYSGQPCPPPSLTPPSPAPPWQAAPSLQVPAWQAPASAAPPCKPALGGHRLGDPAFDGTRLAIAPPPPPPGRRPRSRSLRERPLQAWRRPV